MSTDKRITNGQHEGKLELLSRKELFTRWLDAQVTYLETLRDVGDRMHTVLDGLEESGMSALALEPLRDAVEGLDHSLTLQKIEGMRTAVHDNSFSEATVHPKVTAWLVGAMRSPAAIYSGVYTTSERIGQEKNINEKAVEGALPVLSSAMKELTEANRLVLVANGTYIANRALADAADISRQ